MDFFASYPQPPMVSESDLGLEPSLGFGPLYGPTCMADPLAADQLEHTLAVLFDSDLSTLQLPLSTYAPSASVAPLTHHFVPVTAPALAALPVYPSSVPSHEISLPSSPLQVHSEAAPSPCASGSSDTPAPKPAPRRRARPVVTYTTKEPLERNYSSRADFEAAWHRWRQLRDLNNAAVRRSREAKRKRVDDDVVEAEHSNKEEAACGEGCDNCSSLVSTLHQHRRHVDILLKALRNEPLMDQTERDEYAALLARHPLA